jgi:DNA-binding NarL/FixJ family response regulator
MGRKVLLVGHCGLDSRYLQLAVRQASGGAVVEAAEDQEALLAKLAAGHIDLVLMNRELGYGFAPDGGVEMIRLLRGRFANLRMMLVSNYAEAQQAAIAAGALPGFGKREIGTARVRQMLRAALSSDNSVTD